jgi:hypothetical protein
MLRKPVTWIAVSLLAAFGLYWFAPWKLFTTKTVHEALTQPVASAPASISTSAPASTSASSSASSSAAPSPVAGPVILAHGEFVSHEHPTSGTARIVRTADGARRLELVGLATSDGPDVRVWLTDGSAKPGAYLELGRLKGNRGDQAYPIPADADLTAFRGVDIWCVRFSVSFGAAELR